MRWIGQGAAAAHVDTGVFDQDRYWPVTVDYAKPGRPTCVSPVTVADRGPQLAAVHVLPTLWFRNTWSSGLPNRHPDRGTGAATGSPCFRAAGEDLGIRTTRRWGS